MELLWAKLNETLWIDSVLQFNYFLSYQQFVAAAI